MPPCARCSGFRCRPCRLQGGLGARLGGLGASRGLCRHETFSTTVEDRWTTQGCPLGHAASAPHGEGTAAAPGRDLAHDAGLKPEACREL